MQILQFILHNNTKYNFIINKIRTLTFFLKIIIKLIKHTNTLNQTIYNEYNKKFSMTITKHSYKITPSNKLQ